VTEETEAVGRHSDVFDAQEHDSLGDAGDFRSPGTVERRIDQFQKFTGECEIAQDNVGKLVRIALAIVSREPVNIRQRSRDRREVSHPLHAPQQEFDGAVIRPVDVCLIGKPCLTQEQVEGLAHGGTIRIPALAAGLESTSEKAGIGFTVRLPRNR